MMEIHFNLQSIEDTAKPVASMLHPGMPLLLFGEMGAGKTTLTKSIVRSLGCGEEVTSPTFPLMQSYQTAQYVLWHIDLYRLDKPHQTDELGLDELNHECILIIEWPERLPKGIFNRYLKGQLTVEGDHRKLIVERYEWIKH